MSIANLDRKLIFIHVPKTAGSSMEHASFVGGGGHQTIEYFRRAFELSFIGLPKFENLFKFGFVRNPYTRFASAATAHYMGHGKQNESNDNYELTKKGFLKFTYEHLEKIRSAKWPEFMHLIPQYKFLHFTGQPAIGLGWKDSGMDFIGKFENIDEDWRKVCEKAGVPHEELSRWRVNSFQDYDSLYTQTTKDWVYELYQKDFELFGYAK